MGCQAKFDHYTSNSIAVQYTGGGSQNPLASLVGHPLGQGYDPPLQTFLSPRYVTTSKSKSDGTTITSSGMSVQRDTEF